MKLKVMQSGCQTYVRRQIIFRRTCTPAILFWAPYSHSGPSNFGRLGQFFWRIICPYAVNGSPGAEQLWWRSSLLWSRYIHQEQRTASGLSSNSW